MKNEEDKLISAQVVLNAASAADPQMVADEFTSAGFTVGPIFANSFAITANSSKFEKYFRVALHESAGEGVQVKLRGRRAASSELPLNALSAEVKDQVEAILFVKPPDFGLGISY
jgi:hypothetical protein